MTNETTPLTELEKLKHRLFQNNHDTETEQIDVLVDVMEVVGGYEQLMNMPIPAIQEVYSSLVRKQKAMEKATKRK